MEQCPPGVVIPVVTANFCSPVTNFGQIKKIHFGNLGNPFTDVTDLAEWTSRRDNATTTGTDYIRTLYGIGSKAAPEKTEVEFSLGRKLNTDSEHSFTFRVDEMSDENYALMKFLEDNPGIQIPVWWEVQKFLYGGNDGVTCTMDMVEITPEDKNALQYFELTISFEGSSPQRDANPMAA